MAWAPANEQNVGNEYGARMTGSFKPQVSGVAKSEGLVSNQMKVNASGPEDSVTTGQMTHILMKETAELPRSHY